MDTTTPITADWKRWLTDNLVRGCSVASMIESMVKAQIDPETAGRWVRDAQTVRLAAGIVAPYDPPGAAAHNYAYDMVRLPRDINVIYTTDRDVRVTMRVARPVIAIFADLLSAQECDELVRLSSVKLKRSTIVDPHTGEQKHIDARSSDGTYFMVNETDFIARLDRRIAEVMHWPIENGEGLQILRYGMGGEYQTHYDYFVPEDAGSVLHVVNGGQRVSTLIIYLNDVEQGGETVFPAVGLGVVPRKGSAVYFEYCNAQGQVDPLTLHGGTPVTAGEKWIATKWMRERRYG